MKRHLPSAIAISSYRHLDDLLTVLLAQPDLYREMNEAYAKFFPEAKPARAMVRFGADIAGVLVAIEAIALV